MERKYIHQDKIPRYRREGKEEGISIGIKYWEINMAVSEIINNASAQESIEEKMRILSTQGEYVQHLYYIFKSNPGLVKRLTSILTLSLYSSEVVWSPLILMLFETKVIM
mgnify:CR=1 FL=1